MLRYVKGVIIINYTDLGYGTAKYKEINYNPVYQSPIYFINSNNRTKINYPIFFIPSVMYWDEVFVDLNPNLIINTHDRYMVSNYGRIFDKYTNKFVPSRTNDKTVYDGYLAAHIRFLNDNEEGKWYQKDLYISRAVLGSFNYIPGCEFLEVDHVNGIHTDNRLCNLEWVTPEENIRRSKENNFNSKAYYNKELYRNNVSEKDAEEICKLYNEGLLFMDISIKLGIDKDIVKMVLCGNLYREISQKYGITNSININLSDTAVHDICDRLQKGSNIISIASETGVDKLQIKDIKEGKYRKDISSQYDFSKSLDLDGYRKTITDEIARDICKLVESGKYTEKQIAEKLNINEEVVGYVKRNKNYKDIRSNYNILRKNPELLSKDKVLAIAEDLINSGLKDIDIAKKHNVSRSIIGNIKRKDTYSQYTTDYDFNNRVNKPSYGVLSLEDVHKICNIIIDNKIPYIEIAKKFKVSVKNIESIRYGNSYKDIVNLYIDKFPPIKQHKTDDNIIKFICEDLQKGIKNVDICKKYNISKSVVKRIKNRSYRKDISKDYNW